MFKHLTPKVVGIKEKELQALTLIAQQNQKSLSFVIRVAIVYFLKNCDKIPDEFLVPKSKP